MQSILFGRNKSALQGNRIPYLDVLRVISCILVIGVHVSASNITALGYRGMDFGVTYAADWLSLLGVPLFFMISGALTLSASYQITLRKAVLHKFLHYIILFYVWRMIYQLYSISGEPITWSRFIKSIGPEGATFYHLWFLSSIAILYLLLPLLRTLFTDNEKNCRYFILLYFIFILFIPEVLRIPGLSPITSYYTQHDFSLLSGYAGYFVLGYYLHLKRESWSRRFRMSSYALGIIGGGIAIVCGYLASKSQHVLADYLTSPLNATSFFGAVAIFLLFQQITKNCAASSILFYLSGQTFGVYLLHPLIMNLLISAGFDTLRFPALISIPLYVILLFIICTILSSIISCIPLLRRLIQ